MMSGKIEIALRFGAVSASLILALYSMTRFYEGEDETNSADCCNA